MAKVAKTPTTVLPTGRYRPATAARMMGIARCTLYKYISEKRVKSEFTTERGMQKHYIRGIEIIRFKECSTYTC